MSEHNGEKGYWTMKAVCAPSRKIEIEPGVVFKKGTEVKYHGDGVFGVRETEPDWETPVDPAKCTVHPEMFPDYVSDNVDEYRALRAVLEEIFNRAAFGKGKARHAVAGERFEEQYILRGARTYGLGGLYFQINKKLEESFRMSGEARANELMDIAVYAAAAIIKTREESQGNEDKISH